VTTALLFDRDRVEEIGGWTEGLPRIGRSALLWIDLERPQPELLDDLARQLELEDETRRRFENRRQRPALSDHGRYLHVTVIGLVDSADRELACVECLVSERWLVTIRDSPLPVIDRFKDIAGGSGEIGRLDGLRFLALLLEWALGSYLDAFETLEADLEEIDARAMGGQVTKVDEVVASLVEMRREVGRLRRALVAHREVVLALTRPELEALGDEGSAERFATLGARLEDAVQASRDTRHGIVGSFDVVIATTGQRTNEVMKVLTLASVLLLPGALIAGIMGMNFRLGLFENAAYFWVVLGTIGFLAIVTIATARARHWI
jgi:Mg2+ and Co2+ transporter CorA